MKNTTDTSINFHLAVLTAIYIRITPNPLNDAKTSLFLSLIGLFNSLVWLYASRPNSSFTKGLIFVVGNIFFFSKCYEYDNYYAFTQEEFEMLDAMNQYCCFVNFMLMNGPQSNDEDWPVYAVQKSIPHPWKGTRIVNLALNFAGEGSRNIIRRVIEGDFGWYYLAINPYFTFYWLTLLTGPNLLRFCRQYKNARSNRYLCDGLMYLFHKKMLILLITPIAIVHWDHPSSGYIVRCIVYFLISLCGIDFLAAVPFCLNYFSKVDHVDQE